MNLQMEFVEPLGHDPLSASAVLSEAQSVYYQHKLVTFCKQLTIQFKLFCVISFH